MHRVPPRSQDSRTDGLDSRSLARGPLLPGGRTGVARAGGGEGSDSSDTPPDGDGEVTAGEREPAVGDGATATADDREHTGPEDDEGPPRAGLGRRVGAHVVDVVVLVPVFWGSALLVALVTGGTSDAGFSLSGLPALVGFGLYFLLMAGYLVGTEAAFGRTAGKRLLGLRVVDGDGDAPGPKAATVRNVTRLVEGAPFFWFFLFYVVSLALVAVDDANRRLGDRLASTAVVRAD